MGGEVCKFAIPFVVRCFHLDDFDMLTGLNSISRFPVIAQQSSVIVYKPFTA
jgi:hypothetical protein